MKNFYLTPNYDIRWRFEYSDNTATKYGAWSRQCHDLKEMGSFIRRENLSRVFIEMRCKRSGEVSTPVHCAGWDFVMLRWEYVANIGFSTNQMIGSHTPTPIIIGLTLVTRELEVLLRVDSKTPVIRTRTEEDKKYNYACFGK